MVSDSLNQNALKYTYFQVSLEQVDVETKLFPIVELMKTTTSNQDYMEMQELTNFLWILFRRNEERMEFIKKQIETVES